MTPRLQSRPHEWNIGCHGQLVALCCAEDVELPPALRRQRGLSACPENHCRVVETRAGRPYLVCITGPGMVSAAAAASHLLDVHQVGFLVIMGFMGRISDSVPFDCILLVSKTLNYSSLHQEVLTGDSSVEAARTYAPHERAVRLVQSVADDLGIRLEEGIVLSAEAPLHDHRVGRQLARVFSAVGVDMETAAIAQVAATRKRSWISLRVPSDDADENAATAHAAARECGFPAVLGRVVDVLVDRLAGPAESAGNGNAHDGVAADAEDDLLRATNETVFHPFARPSTDDSDIPRVIERAFGARVWDARGRCYLDGVAGTKNVCLGHGHPAVFPFLAEQNSRLAHWPADGYTNRALVEFSDKLAGLLPNPLRHVFANSGGSEAIETALRMSREYHRCRGQGHRYKVLALSGGYHGATAGALSVTGHSSSRSGAGPLVEGVLFVDPPASDSPDSINEALVRLDRALELAGPDHLASIIFEPTQGLGGVRPLPERFLGGLIDAAREVGALAVADEVASGLGRTGRWFDFTRVAAQPDIVVCGKALTNGTIPLSATVASDEVYRTICDRAPSLRHGHTYSGHPLAAAAACRVLHVMMELDILRRVRAREDEFNAGAADAIRQSPLVADLRQVGLWTGVELRGPPGGGPHCIERVSRSLTRNGVIHEVLGATLALSPPLSICRDDWAEMCAILVRTIREES